MPNRVSLLICLAFVVALGLLAAAGCGNDGELVVREPDNPAVATRTPVSDQE